MKSAGILSEFARKGWYRALLVVAVRGDDGHLKFITDTFQRRAFAIFEYIDPATNFVVTSLTHRASGNRVRLFASLQSAAAAAEIADEVGEWGMLKLLSAQEQEVLWDETKAAWRNAGLERSIWFPSDEASDSLPTWGRVGERPRVAPEETSEVPASVQVAETLAPSLMRDLFSDTGRRTTKLLDRLVPFRRARSAGGAR